MGLSVSVGMLVDVKKYDEEGYGYYLEQFRQVNKVLKKAGVGEHFEPEDIAYRDTFSCDMWGYSGLHYLRRIAASLALGKGLPEPGTKDTYKDETVDRYYEKAADSSVGFFEAFFSAKVRSDLDYQHLIMHSDCEGYYIPLDFEDVLDCPKRYKIEGGLLGSTYRLYDECKELARHLEIPLELDHESERVEIAGESQGCGSSKWERYGIESFTCLRMLRACEASLKFKAAIVFC
jgi:hypothetical protein